MAVGAHGTRRAVDFSHTWVPVSVGWLSVAEVSACGHHGADTSRLLSLEYRRSRLLRLCDGRGDDCVEGKFEKMDPPTCFASPASFKTERHHYERDGRGNPLTVGAMEPGVRLISVLRWFW